jgi:Type IV leader peptidase family.
MTDFVLCAGLAGWIAGILVNYLAETYTTNGQLGRPTCTSCGEEQDWLGFLLFARCHFCGAPRPFSGRFIEVGLAATSAVLASFLGPTAFWGSSTLLAAFIVFVAVVDIRYRVILLESQIAGVLICFWTGAMLWGVMDTLLAGAIGFGAMLVLYAGMWGYHALVRKEKLALDDARFPLGFGDVLLVGVLSLTVGTHGIFPMLFYGSLAGAITILGINLTRSVLRKPWIRTVPYAPFLLAGTVIALLFLSHLLPLISY